jgi:hypothetical protein
MPAQLLPRGGGNGHVHVRGSFISASLAAALGPSRGGAMFAAGMMSAPLVVAGALKIAYDLALWFAFRRVRERE